MTHDWFFMEIGSALESAVRKLGMSNLDAFEVAAVSRDSLVIEAKRQMIELFQRSQSRGLAVRVVKGNQLGFSATTDFSQRNMDDVVAMAIDSMKHTAPSDESTLPPPQDAKEGLAEHVGRAFGEIPDDEKKCVALALESAAIAAESKVTRVQHPRFEENVIAMQVVNSKGVRAAATRGLVLCELRAIAEDKGEAEAAFEFAYSPRFENLDYESVAVLASRRAAARLGAKATSAGPKTIVFDPRAAAVIAKIAAPSFFANNVQRGKSALAGRRGENFYSPKISFVDDGLLSGGYSSFPFDGEGIPRRRSMLARNGVVEGWLYDGARAVIDKTRSTGSCAREDVLRMPATDVSNFFVKAGASIAADIVKGVSKGILVTDLQGAHTANSVSGDFSLGLEGFEIDSGALGGPVRGMTIAANVHDLFRRVAIVGDDLKFFGSYGSPTLVVEGLMVGA